MRDSYFCTLSTKRSRDHRFLSPLRSIHVICVALAVRSGRLRQRYTVPESVTSVTWSLIDQRIFFLLKPRPKNWMFIESTFHILKIRSVKVLKLRFDKSSMPSLKAVHKSHSSTFCYSLSLFGFCPCGSFADERSGADVSLCVPFSLSHAYFT